MIMSGLVRIGQDVVVRYLPDGQAVRMLRKHDA